MVRFDGASATAEAVTAALNRLTAQCREAHRQSASLEQSSTVKVALLFDRVRMVTQLKATSAGLTYHFAEPDADVEKDEEKLRPASAEQVRCRR